MGGCGRRTADGGRWIADDGRRITIFPKIKIKERRGRERKDLQAEMIRCSPSKWSGKTSNTLFTFFNPLFKMPDTTNGCEICEIQASDGEQRVISAWRSFLSLPLFLSSASPPSVIRHPPSASAHPYPHFTESRWSMTKRSILIGLGKKYRPLRWAAHLNCLPLTCVFEKIFERKLFFLF